MGKNKKRLNLWWGLGYPAPRLLIVVQQWLYICERHILFPCGVYHSSHADGGHGALTCLPLWEALTFLW